MLQKLTCFNAYDVRGELGVNIDEEIVYRIGRAFARTLSAKKVIVGWDARETSFDLAMSLSRGLIHEGVEVLSIGLSGTEEMYWATTEFNACGGIEITASHNPINFNGLKMVKEESQPLDSFTEFMKIKEMAEANNFEDTSPYGSMKDIGFEAKKNCR